MCDLVIVWISEYLITHSLILPSLIACSPEQIWTADPYIISVVL